MSMWSHINGNIRLDEFMFHDTEKVKSILGKMAVYNKENSGLPIKDFSILKEDIKLPYGSEGSILYSVITNTDEHSLPAHSISLWGDLRDYDLSIVNDEMIPWFQNLLNEFMKNNLSIRNAILQIEVESGETIILIADTNNIDFDNHTIKVKQINLNKTDF